MLQNIDCGYTLELPCQGSSNVYQHYNLRCKRKNQRTNGPVNAHLRSAILTKYLIKNLPFMGPHQPIKIKDWDKSQPNCRGLLYKHFCKNRIQISEIGPEKNSQFPLFPTTCISSKHLYPLCGPSNVCKVSKVSVLNCRRSCAHKVPSIHSLKCPKK